MGECRQRPGSSLETGPHRNKGRTVMAQTTDRILTTHVGSLIRPPKLIEFWRAIEDGKPHDAAAFEAALTESVAEVVRQQADAGIDIVSDGEFSKGLNWAFYIFKRLSGIAVRPATASGM